MANEIRLRDVPQHIMTNISKIQTAKPSLKTNTQVIEFLLNRYPDDQKLISDQQKEISDLKQQLRDYEATQGNFKRHVQDFASEMKREASYLVKNIQQSESYANSLLKKLVPPKKAAKKRGTKK